MSNIRNFVILTDSEGKMPIMTKIGVPVAPSIAKHHRYWVEYRNDKPTKVRPYPKQEKVWDYAANEYILVSSIPNVN